MVAQARASALRATSRSLGQLARRAARNGGIDLAASVALDFPDDIAVQRRPPYDSRADSVMYCQVLVVHRVRRAARLDVHLFNAKDVDAQAARNLGAGPAMSSCAGRGQRWTPSTKHRIGLAAAIVGLTADEQRRVQA